MDGNNRLYSVKNLLCSFEIRQKTLRLGEVVDATQKQLSVAERLFSDHLFVRSAACFGLEVLFEALFIGDCSVHSDRMFPLRTVREKENGKKLTFTFPAGYPL